MLLYSDAFASQHFSPALRAPRRRIFERKVRPLLSDDMLSGGKRRLFLTELMQVMGRACGHHLNQFNPNDLSTWKKEMCLSGRAFVLAASCLNIAYCDTAELSWTSSFRNAGVWLPPGEKSEAAFFHFFIFNIFHHTER